MGANRQAKRAQKSAKKQRKSAVQQVQERLESMKAYGISKHGTTPQERVGKISSVQTMKTYKSVACSFARWVEEHHGCFRLEEAEKFVIAYLAQRQQGEKYSAWTQDKEISALKKLFFIPPGGEFQNPFGFTFEKMPRREEDIIHNRRFPKGFSEENPLHLR